MSGVNFLRRTLIGSAIVAPVAFAIRAEESSTMAKTAAGNFSGIKQENVIAFRGIRYGTAQRFQPPVAYTYPAQSSANAGVQAIHNGPVSPQRVTTVDAQSEDCLNLNVWTPSLNREAKRTVMVYIHGGAYSNGSGNDPLSDGAKLAAQGDVVVVTLTHRLNAFGYLSLGRIDTRFPDSGNVGQLDLILALTWVRDNITAFGGNPRNVMVFGQSGGGGKIATLMATPAAKGLFHNAATMSGQQITASGPINATKRAQTYLAKLNMDVVTAPVEKLVEALDAIDPIIGGSMYFGPVLDGRTLQRHPFWPDAAPQGRTIPMMLGNCIAETRAFFPLNHAKLKGLDWGNIAERIEAELRVDIAPEKVIATYRQWFPQKTPVEIFIAATTAGRSWRGQVIEAEARANAGVPAYVYQLDFENAMHTGDIGLVFGTVPNMSATQQAMSLRMMNAFIAFAKTGNPGWPAYDMTTRKTMVFDVMSRVENNPRGRERELFAVVPYIQSGT